MTVVDISPYLSRRRKMEDLVVEYRVSDMDGEVELYNRFAELGVGRIEADYFLEEVKEKLWDRC